MADELWLYGQDITVSVNGGPPIRALSGSSTEGCYIHLGTAVNHGRFC